MMNTMWRGLDLIGGWARLPSTGAEVRIEDGAPMRVSTRSTGEDPGPSREEVRAELEALTLRWWDLGEWSAAEGDGEVVCSVKPAADQPSHKITFTPPKGAARTWLVMLCEDGAYTHAELDAEGSASWDESDGVWAHEGQPAPGGANGVVTVADLPLVSWEHVPITDSAGNAADPGERLAALAEYRASESIEGWFLGDPDELAATDDGSDLGPRVDEIDWTGFPPTAGALRGLWAAALAGDAPSRARVRAAVALADEATRGNRSLMARALGISRAYLYEIEGGLGE